MLCKTSSAQILESLFNNLKKSEGKANYQRAKDASRKVFTDLNLEKSFGSLFEILWNAQIPCFDVKNVTSRKKDQHGLLKSCSWKGVDMPCSAIFKVGDIIIAAVLTKSWTHFFNRPRPLTEECAALLTWQLPRRCLRPAHLQRLCQSCSPGTAERALMPSTMTGKYKIKVSSSRDVHALQGFQGC